MIRKLFGKKKAETRAANPVEHLKIGAEEVVQWVFTKIKNERGVHVETALAVLGSFGGFCCIDSLLKQVADLGRSTRECGINDVETSDGNRYYLGQPINQLLAGNNLSLLALVAGMINHLGSEDYPDFAEIAAHVARTLGGPEFGRPRVPDKHQPDGLPINFVRELWPLILPHVERRVPTLQERVALFGFAAQNVIQMGKDLIPPEIAGKLVMECAVPMSKLDPAQLWPISVQN